MASNILKQSFILSLFLTPSLSADIDCFVPGLCTESTEVGISFPMDSNGCLQNCKDNDNCLYFSYNFDDDICFELSECNNLVNEGRSVSGHVDCDLRTRLTTMIVVGGGVDEIEVIDLDGRTCNALSDLSNINDHWYGYTKDDWAIPVLCTSSECYEFDGGTWVSTFPPLYDGFESSGVQFEDQTYWKSGGNDDNVPLTHSEYLYSGDSTFVEGPDLPMGRKFHCVVTLNATHAIITGDFGDSSTRKVQMFDKTTETFTDLPQSPEFIFAPACGIAQTVNGPEFVVVDTYSYFGDYIEIYNIESNTWRQSDQIFDGTAGTTDTTYSGYVQYDDTFVVVTNSLTVYQYDPVTETLNPRGDTLNNYREYSFAMLIDGSILDCA